MLSNENCLGMELSNDLAWSSRRCISRALPARNLEYSVSVVNKDQEFDRLIGSKSLHAISNVAWSFRGKSLTLSPPSTLISHQIRPDRLGTTTKINDN